MKMKRIFAVSISLVTALLLILAYPFTVVADTSQIWYLSSNAASGTNADYIIYKNSTSQCSGTVTVSNGTTDYWVADEAATMNLSFPAGDWDGIVVLNTPHPSGEQFTIEIGSWNGSIFSSAGLTTKTGDGNRTVFPFSITDANAFTVAQGNWLSLLIWNPTAGDSDLVVKTDGASYVISPISDPGYPVPELSTIIFLGAGLVGLAAYFGLKRRKRAYIKA
jgi:hypothetical protein